MCMDEHSVENKVSFIFFITGFVIAIMSPFIPFVAYSEKFKIVVLLAIGTFAGVFNITKDEHTHFLVGSSIYILLIANLDKIVGNLAMPEVMGILHNVAIFLLPGAIITSLSISFETLHIRHGSKMAHLHVSPEKGWNLVVLAAIVMVFFQLILEFFFDTSGYEVLINSIDLLSYIIFSIDLAYLYNQKGSLRIFLKECWVDIIAVIPFTQYARLAKMFRFVKILKSSTKISKIVKVHKGVKLFSEHSSFNDYMKVQKK